jgi:CRP-like cAMP-binding protein
MDAAQLKSIPLFAILSERQLADVASHADEVEVEAGRTLMDEGAFGYEFFAVEDGTAEVTRDGAHVAELGPGDIFGEIALLEAPRRTATVRATTPMRLVVMHRRDFRALADRSPAVADRLREIIRERTPQGARGDS